MDLRPIKRTALNLSGVNVLFDHIETSAGGTDSFYRYTN